MIGRVSKLWRGSPPVEFESSFGLSESVERLKAATRRSAFSVLARQEAAGTVKESRVSLQRVIPMVGNSFKPFYRGHFIERNGRVILTGRFTMHWAVKVFMMLWFGAIGCFILIGSIQAARTPGRAILFPLFGIGMIVAGIALVSLGRWFARHDAEWLSDLISDTLCAQVRVQPAPADTFAPQANFSAQPSTTIAIVTAILVLFATACWLAAIFDIEAIHGGPKGVTIGYFPNTVSRYVSACLGAAALILAFGIYRRRLLAWRAGFGLVVGGWGYSVVDIVNTSGEQPGHGVAVIFCVASLLVVFFWIRWWYAQRIHFQH